MVRIELQSTLLSFYDSALIQSIAVKTISVEHSGAVVKTKFKSTGLP